MAKSCPRKRKANPDPEQLAKMRAVIAQLPKLDRPPPSPEEADRILAANGIPPTKPPEETWGQAIASVWANAKKYIHWLGRLAAEAVIAVATPLLTAAVDGLCILVVLMTIWELWRPVEAVADALLARLS